MSLKRRISLGCVAALLVSISLTPLPSQSPRPQAADWPADLAPKLDAVIERGRVQHKIPGLSVAVAVGGQVRYARGFGMADLEHSAPAKTTTLYRTASVAKPMTASAVMQLAEQGKLDLDAPIQKYCPAFPEKPWPVTARQLLAHLGGVRHYQKPGESSGTTHYFGVGDSLAVFKDDPLLHEPGTKFSYTTFGYSVLGCAIEGASGVRYEDYMRERVFHPAGMEHTRTDDHHRILPDRARGYQPLDQATYDRLPGFLKAQVKVGDVFNAELHDTSTKVPGGGLLSTAVDLVRFALGSQGGLLVKKGTLEQMWTPQKTRAGQEVAMGPNRVGLGWFIGQSRGTKVISHTGGQAGTRTALYLFPEKGVVLAVMCNLQNAPLQQVEKEVLDLLLPAAP